TVAHTEKSRPLASKLKRIYAPRVISDHITSWCRRISNGWTSSSLRQRASQKSPTICESWSRRNGRSWCISCHRGCRSPVDLLLLDADKGRPDDCSPNCRRPKAD